MYYFVTYMPNILDGSMSIHMGFESMLHLALRYSWEKAVFLTTWVIMYSAVARKTTI